MGAFEHNITINSLYLSQYPREKGGYILDFSGYANGLSEEAGKDFVGYFDYPLRDNFYNKADKEQLQERRKEIAEPKLMASFEERSLEGLPDISRMNFVIKNPETTRISLPEDFDFVLPVAYLSGKNALEEFGLERFQSCEIALTVHRSNIPPQEAQNNRVSNWHNHVSHGDTQDRLYLKHNFLGTEVEGGHLPDNTLCSIGGEISHRAVINETDQVIRREWMSLSVRFQPARHHAILRSRSENPVLCIKDEDARYDEYVEAAQEELEQQAQSISVLDKPAKIQEYAELESGL